MLCRFLLVKLAIVRYAIKKNSHDKKTSYSDYFVLFAVINDNQSA
jgi:hypothetical protein